jgi:hypothetical protein
MVFYLTTQTSTGAPFVFKLALRPSWRISPWKFHPSFPFISCVFSRAESCSTTSSRTCLHYYNLIVITILVGPHLCPSRSCSASTWNQYERLKVCVTTDIAGDVTTASHNRWESSMGELEDSGRDSETTYCRYTDSPTFHPLPPSPLRSRLL